MPPPLWLSMLYGGGGGLGAGAAAPAAPLTPQTGLSLADLFTPYQEPPEIQEPAYPSSVRDLDKERQRDLRMRTLLSTLAAGMSGQPGQFGPNALAGALQARDQEQGVVDQERARLQAQFEEAKARRQESIMRAQQQRELAGQQQEAEGILSTYRQIEQMAGAEAPQIVAEARAAALARDSKSLQKLLAEAPQRMAYRRALQAAGVDPDNPMAVEAHQQQAEQQAEIDAEVAKRAALKERNLLWEPNAPPQPRETYYQVVDRGGVLYAYDPRNPSAPGIPVDVPPNPQGNNADPIWLRAVAQAQSERNSALIPGSVNVEERARRLYEIMKSGPAAGAAPPAGAPAPMPPAGGGGGVGASAAPPDAAVINQVAQDLRTMSEDQILRELREDFSPAQATQILAAAKAKAGGKAGATKRYRWQNGKLVPVQ